MNYRKATLCDISQLAELRKKQLFDEGYRSDNSIDDALREYFTYSIQNETLIVWVALESDKIISTAGVCFFQYPPSYSNKTGKIAYITNVYTQIEYRRQETATKLLEYILAEIQKRDYKVVRLHASSQGKKLYEKMGFVNAKGFMVKKL